MKTIICSILPAMFTLIVYEQKPETTKESTTHSLSPADLQKSTNEVSTSVLDGKIFKITFIAKAPQIKPVEGNASADHAGVDADKMNAANAVASLDNTKARLKFENGMLRIYKTTDADMMDRCQYLVTKGTSDFASFISRCGNEIPGTTNSSSKNTPDQPVNTTNQVQDKTGIKATGVIAGDQPVVGTTDAGIETTDRSATDAVLKDKTNISAGEAMPIRNSADEAAKPAPPAAQSGPSYIMTGFVEGKSISGTIIFRNGGGSTTYSFNGLIDMKREKGDLGLNKQ